MGWGWFSADEDGDVVAHTRENDDGSVHRYDYTEPDNMSAGHGHSAYDSMNDYLDGNSRYDRDKDDSRSAGRSWRGNCYTLETLSQMPFGKLQKLEANASNEYIKQSAKRQMGQSSGMVRVRL